MAPSIHSTALVGPGARIADDVVIGPMCIVEDGVELGAGVTLQSGVVVSSGTKIGDECRIAHGAVIGTAPQDLKFKNEPTGVEIGARTTIREYCTINRATTASWTTRVGADCLLMAYTHVAHDCQVGNKVIIANATQMGGHVHVDDWAILGGNVGIHQFTHVGAHTMVGAGSYLSKDVPPYVLVGGEHIGYAGLNVIGLKRRGFTTETIDTLRALYKLIYRSGLNVSDGLSRAEAELPQLPEVRLVVDFIRSSGRGIVRGK